MIDTYIQQQIINRLSKGLPICEHPYLELAQDFGVEESELIAFLQDALEDGTIKRMGFIVNHHKIGFKSNAMVVWDIPDNEVDKVGELLGNQTKITLCYQRPRRLPDWPYNLFTMIHGKHRPEVIDYLQKVVDENDLNMYPRDVLFSTKKFKQTGAKYYG